MSTSENWTRHSDARQLATADKEKLRKKNIKSPEVGQSKYHVVIGKGHYFTDCPLKHDRLLTKKAAYEADLKKFIGNQIK